jgi:hypothetical protein
MWAVARGERGLRILAFAAADKAIQLARQRRPRALAGGAVVPAPGTPVSS